MTTLLRTAALVTLLYAPVTIGLAVAFRLLNYPDLTCEGSFMLGGALSFVGIEAGLPPVLALVIALVGGMAAGALTGVLHTKLKVSRLLSGIITAAILYSLTVRLLGGWANRRVTRATVFDVVDLHNASAREFIVASAITLAVLASSKLLYDSHLGRLLRALGDQEWFCISLGKSVATLLVAGLAVSNALIALSGAVLTQFNHVCDVNMASGVLISALAALVLGETAYSAKSVWGHTLMCLVGTALYNVALGAFYFDWGLGIERLVMPSDVRLVTGLLFIVPALVLLRARGRYRLFNSSW
ncbi:MAG: ABC transporter permease [Terriglobia bacterium]